MPIRLVGLVMSVGCPFKGPILVRDDVGVCRQGIFPVPGVARFDIKRYVGSCGVLGEESILASVVQCTPDLESHRFSGRS
jgi:hypothetical protein